MPLPIARRGRDPRRQPAPARLGAADPGAARDTLGARARPAARRRDRSLHRDDVPAHPVHRAARRARGEARRLAARALQRPRAAREPARQRRRARRAPVGDASGRSTTACPRTSRGCCGDAGVEFGYLYEDDLYAGALAHDLGADEAVAVHAQRVAAVFRKHGVRARDHDRSAHDAHAARGLPEARRRLRRAGAELPRGARRARAAVRRPALAREVVVHDSCVYARYEDVVAEPRELLTAAGFTVARAGERGQADVVLRRPGRGALSRRRRRGRRRARRQLPTPPETTA